MSEEPERPTVSQPLHGPRRSYGKPAILVIAILLAVLAVFALITYLRYET
ncbi:hypothetical protein [Nocardioides antri]|nr:hypothetical protein [Nocardioides antri]